MDRNRNDLLRKNKELEKVLIHTTKLSSLGEMSASIAHELRGSLSAMSMSVDLLWNSMQENKNILNYQKYYDTCKEEIKHSAETIENLLDFSRKSSCKKEVVDISSLINNILAFKSKTIFLFSIEVKKTFSGTAKIKANKDSMKIIFINLIENAIQAMNKSGGVLEVCINGGKTSVTIEISDTGQGIPEENRHQIWESFFTTKGEKGNGIGLYLAKMEVKKHGGTIILNDQRGKGASFLVKLPLNGGK